jgi:hypothetical protein
MATVKLYQFQMYNITSDQMQESKRWGTKAGIEGIRGAYLLEGTEIEVEVSEVTWDHPDYPQLTVRAWSRPLPHRMR